MPASFTVYINDTQMEYEKVVLSPTTYIEFFKNFLYKYDDPECKKEPIGILAVEQSVHIFPTGNMIQNGNAYNNFYSNSGLPYGDANILIVSFSNSTNLLNNASSQDSSYSQQVNPILSTGEWSGQIGYENATIDKTNPKISKHEFNFPLPIVTYTNAFNSLPQPSTAPLPA